jgi:hypothetical protein
MYGNYEYLMDSIDTELILTIIGAVSFVLVILGVLGLVLYVLKSLGMQAIAKRRGIGNAWLAWLPIGCEWIAGSISDQYRYNAKGQVTNRRTVMLILAIARMILGGMSSAATVGSMFEILEYISMGNEEAAINAFLSGSGSGVSGLLGSGVSIAAMVFWYMSMYDLYSSCCPQNNTLFVVLSIFFGFLEPFFIFCNRNKDDGMAQEKFASQQPTWQAPQPAQQIPAQSNRVEGDPWDNVECE